MRVVSRFAALLLASTTFIAPSAFAATDFITGYAGYFDVTQQDHTAVEFGAEYRMAPLQYGIRPTVGISATNHGSVYGYGGINWDVELLPNQLYLVPNFMAGAYHKGDGKDLGGTIEFRSGIELDYQFQNAHRLGIAFNHRSNASLYTHNPGVETVLLNYSIPLGLTH